LAAALRSLFVTPRPFDMTPVIVVVTLSAQVFRSVQTLSAHWSELDALSPPQPAATSARAATSTAAGRASVRCTAPSSHGAHPADIIRS